MPHEFDHEPCRRCCVLCALAIALNAAHTLRSVGSPHPHLQSITAAASCIGMFHQLARGGGGGRHRCNLVVPRSTSANSGYTWPTSIQPFCLLNSGHAQFRLFLFASKPGQYSNRHRVNLRRSHPKWADVGLASSTFDECRPPHFDRMLLLSGVAGSSFSTPHSGLQRMGGGSIRNRGSASWCR